MTRDNNIIREAAIALMNALPHEMVPADGCNADDLMPLVITVLNAVSEPSEVMESAGMAEADKTSFGAVVAPIWRAMMAAAIEEGLS